MYTSVEEGGTGNTFCALLDPLKTRTEGSGFNVDGSLE
jgi:hypothetical protein